MSASSCFSWVTNERPRKTLPVYLLLVLGDKELWNFGTSPHVTAPTRGQCIPRSRRHNAMKNNGSPGRARTADLVINSTRYS